MYYVYAPLSGQSWVKSDSTYCYVSGNHPGTCTFSNTTNISKPLDIGNISIAQHCRLYASSNILSVKIIRRYDCVCGGGACNNVNDAVEVEFYRSYNATDYLGSVLYGHLNASTLHSNGVYNYPNYNGNSLGKTVADDCGTPCYEGIHIHLAAKNGVLNPSTYCGMNFYSGGTWMYRWQAI